MIERLKASLNFDDLEIVENFQSWDDVQNQILDGDASRIALLRPALGHLDVFVEYFESKLGANLNISYLWGSLACLLQVSILSLISGQWKLTHVQAYDGTTGGFGNDLSHGQISGTSSRSFQQLLQ